MKVDPKLARAKRRSRTFLCGCVLTLVAALGGGCTMVSVKTDHDRRVDFQRYRTFQMMRGQVMVDGRLDNRKTLVKDRIGNAITSALIGKGMLQVDSGADLIVSYVVGARTRTEIESAGRYSDGVGPYWGPGGWWGPGYADWWTGADTKGTLVIDLIDALSKRLAWRAYARADFTSPDAEKIIDTGVRKSFAEFPPAELPVFQTALGPTRPALLRAPAYP